MQPEDLLLVLCLHGSKHCWERLAWICDVAELIGANPELDWNEIMRRSAALNIEKAVMLGLDLASELVDAPRARECFSNHPAAPKRATAVAFNKTTAVCALEQPDRSGRAERPFLADRRAITEQTSPSSIRPSPSVCSQRARIFRSHYLMFGRFLYYPLRLSAINDGNVLAAIVGRLF